MGGQLPLGRRHSLGVQRPQFKSHSLTTVRHHCTPPRQLESKRQTIASVGEHVGGSEASQLQAGMENSLAVTT